MSEGKHAPGIELLRRPVMPLVAMVEFFFMTGDFTTVAEVIDQLPEPIDTERAFYPAPRGQLQEYLSCFAVLEGARQDATGLPAVVDEAGNRLDPYRAASLLARQQVLTAELERINSLLCGPCGCVFCCTGPEEDMVQEFFEIPLAAAETAQFPGERVDSEQSRRRLAADEDELILDGEPFYRRSAPFLVHWQNGWSLIMPRETSCPHLAAGSGRCRIYAERPAVCRRPQIFPYLLEPVEHPGGVNSFRVRQTLLAITDCPYVRELRDEIAGYAAASELHLAVRGNKG